MVNLKAFSINPKLDPSLLRFHSHEDEDGGPNMEITGGRCLINRSVVQLC